MSRRGFRATPGGWNGIRSWLLAAGLVLCSGGHVWSAPILSLDGLPASYTPATPFTFRVLLQGAQDLAAFNIELRMTASDPTAQPDVDFGFTDRFVFAPSPPGKAQSHGRSRW